MTLYLLDSIANTNSWFANCLSVAAIVISLIGVLVPHWTAKLTYQAHRQEQIANLLFEKKLNAYSQFLDLACALVCETSPSMMVDLKRALIIATLYSSDTTTEKLNLLYASFVDDKNGDEFFDDLNNAVQAMQNELRTLMED